MSHTATPSRNQMQRASKPKVKTGCITCKIRRVKCDETKPECLRCRSFGCDCDGYEFPSRAVSRVVPQRPLMPRARGAVQIQPRSPPSGVRPDELIRGKRGFRRGRHKFVAYGVQQRSMNISSETISHSPFTTNTTTRKPASLSIVSSPSETIFESEQEARYFRFYCDTTARQLSGSFGDNTWSHSFLQACHEEPFVRRAIIAIAALSKAMESSQVFVTGVKALPDIKEASSHDGHHVFALQQYGKAVGQMRVAFGKRQDDIRMTLLSCLLTVCFESFHGHHENAISQMIAGLNIMQDWLDKQHIAIHQSGLKSPNPHVVDENLFHSFMRLDISAMHFFDKRSGDFHREQSLKGLETVEQMPHCFSDVEEASIYFSLVKKRIMHFSKWIESKAFEHRHHKQVRLGKTDIESTYPHRHIKVVLGHKLLELEIYSGDLDRWSIAFQPLLDRSRTPEGQRDDLQATSLAMQQNFLFIMLKGLKCHEECLFDQYLSEFEEIVRLADTLLTHPHLTHSAGKAVFVFDPNIVLPLLVVAIKCRDWAIRRRAIELLQSNPRREGTWDSSLAAGIGLWHMILEEKGLPAGQFVSEQNRVRLAYVKQDFDKRTAIVGVSQEVDGQTTTHETTINW